MFRFYRPPTTLFILLLLAILSLVSSVPLWSVDWFVSHENIDLIERVIAYTEEIRHGDIYPRWLSLTYYGKGSPFANFYSPGFYLLSAWLHSLGLPLLISLKIPATLLFFAGSWGMYLWTRPHFGNIGSVAAAIVYLFTPYHFVNIYVRGAFAEFAALAVLPYLFWAIDRTIKAGLDLRESLLLGICSAMLLLFHNLSVVTIFPLAGLYTLCGLWHKGMTRSNLIAIGLAPVIGIGLSAFYWLPVILERKFLNNFSEAVTSGYFSFENHFVYPEQWFSTTWGFGGSVIGPNDGMSFQVGLLFMICIPLSLLLFRKLSIPQRKFVTINLVCGFLALLLTTSITTSLYHSIPILSFVQFPWRFLGPATLFLAAACGAYGAAFQANRLNFVPIILLVVASLWISSAQRSVREFTLTASEKTDVGFISSLGTGLGSLCAANEYLPASANDNVIKIISDGKPYSPTGDYSGLLIDGKTMSFSFIGRRPNNLIIIPWFYFPGWELRIDGQTLPAAPSPEGFVSFSVPAGNHDVSIRFGTTPPRVVGWLLSFLTVVGCVWILFIKKGSRSARAS